MCMALHERQLGACCLRQQGLVSWSLLASGLLIKFIHRCGQALYTSSGSENELISNPFAEQLP